MDWYNTDKQLDPIIKAGIFIFDFLTIHPFEDGNGRVSRLITNYLLLNLGLEASKFVSIEEYIYNNIEEYYNSPKLHTKKCLQTSHQTKPVQVATFLELKSNIEFPTKSLKQILEVEYEISKDTLKKTLPILIQNNFVAQRGEARATTYIRTLHNQGSCSLEKITEILSHKTKTKKTQKL